MKVWVNIVSVCEQVPKEALLKLAQEGPKPVYSSVGKKVIGRSLRYEIRNEVDLWAEIEVDPEDANFKRTAGIMDTQFNLHAVLATNLAREDIRKLTV